MTLFDGAALYASATGSLGARLRSAPPIPPPAVVLHTAPPGLVAFPDGRPMRHVPVAGRDEPPPEDLLRPGNRSRIIVSRSTVADPRPDRLMSSVVAVAEDADVEIVLARPDPRVATGPLPPNVRAVDWLPFAAAFPAAAGVVHHGGAGTLLTALAAGVPQLLVPGSGDRRENAELIARRGAGLAVEAKRITARDLERLVSDDGLRTAAREVAAEIAAMPHPADLVDDLAALAR
jgi:UDP:flavonoid glycosyltransferase YjiC (YdhE family)